MTLFLAFTGASQSATIIDPGFNLFETQPVSKFFFGPPVPNQQFVDFEGNQLGTFDFGDGNGPVNVGNTDTIVERKEEADIGGGSDTIDIELVALSLVSVAPVDLGFGAGFEDLFINLNTSSPSVQSKMTIFDTGVFDSILNFSFDVTGSVGGFYATIEKTLEASNQNWQHEPNSELQIFGVNHLLNGFDETNDFWANGLVIHDDGSDTAIHSARMATIPLPAAFPLFLGAFGFLGLLGRRRRVFNVAFPKVARPSV